ncbi:MAG TPA: PSD1 and planctomycete cytochrome C domain-containing protein [Urbifossiella sp.]|nr:PSD1 and planctomycete cytochrome C domain-containing protein [Urbifossiella sp.]
MSLLRLTAATAVLAALLAGRADAGDYLTEVKPLLAARCVACHGSLAQKGKLRLDTAAFARAGGRSGPAVVPGKAADSPLYQAVLGRGRDRMPPESDGHPLAADQVAVLKAWIDRGAPGPADEPVPEAPTAHWAFRPVRRPTVPDGRNPIDHFVQKALREHNLAPAPRADPRTLVRRLYLDLTGLPPTPAEVTAFAADASPQAAEKLVDRLLASPHFGERWGRHWLDLARYAESDGYENDNLRPGAWRFRDWVVKAVNDDVPFDRFTVEQLAGDLLPDATPGQRVGAGFHRHTLWNSAASGDKEEFRTYAVNDRTETTGLVWMGLTVGCARCHAHKYDPVSHADYYRLFAFFNATGNAEVPLADGKAAAPTIKREPRETHVHLRGNFLQPGPVVAPGTPAFLPPLASRGEAPDRLDLARWLVDPAHPLTARVAANHVWQHLFGAGLVATPENFGRAGTRPRHPELLDWLASEYVRLGWSRKSLIRTVVLSAAYQQSSRRPEGTTDPGNDLLGRQNRFRVEAEIVRDLALSAGGLLKTDLGGPSIVPPFPDGLLDQKFTNEALRLPTAERHRRGIYVHVQRTLPHPTLAAFDAADGNTPCVRRDRSLTPTHALTLLNDPVFVECSRALGERLRAAPGGDDARVRFAFELCLARPPADREREVLRALLARHRAHGATEVVVWHGVGRTMLNLEEFTTRE